MKDEIDEATRCLIGLEVSHLGFAGNMRGIHFGELRRRKGHFVGAYALHLQCPWRLERAGIRLTGFHDYYSPASDNTDEAWDPNSGRGSLQAEVLRTVFRLNHGDHERREPATGKAGSRKVVSVRGDRFGGLLIAFSGGMRLRVFPAGAAGEHWRLFQPGKKAGHFVIDGVRALYE